MQVIHVRTTMCTLLVVSVAGLAACAAPSEPETEELNLSRQARALVDEKGEVAAALDGRPGSRETEVVCQRYKRTGSHMTETYCYTRAERDSKRERTRIQWHEALKRGAPDPNSTGGGVPEGAGGLPDANRPGGSGGPP